MPTTQADAVKAVRLRLNEPIERQWTNEFIRGLLNEAMKDAARLTFALFDTKSVVLAPSTTTYTLTNDILQIHMVEYLPGDGRRITLRGRQREAMPGVWGHSQGQTTGEPVFYATWGFPPALALQLFPAPNVASNMTLYVSRLPVMLATDGSASASNLDFPEGWVDTLYDYVEMRALRKDTDQRWQECKQLYDANIAQMQTAADSYIREAFTIIDEGEWAMARYRNLGFYW